MAIRVGRFREGGSLPSILTLQTEGFGSATQIRRAIEALQAEGVLSQPKPGMRYQICRGRFGSRSFFGTYEDGFMWLVSHVLSEPGSSTIGLCENWLPANINEEGIAICEPVHMLADVIEKRQAEGKSTRFRLLITWPGDMGSLMRRIWTRRDCWGLYANQNDNLDVSFYATALMVAKEVCACNNAVRNLAESYSEQVEARYTMSWASSPMFFVEEPNGPLVAGMYHASRSSYDSPAEVLEYGNVRAVAHREEFSTLWGLSHDMATIQNEYSEGELAIGIFERFQNSCTEFVDRFRN